MSDRLRGCWVAFEQDYREEDAELLLQAIKQLKGVANVTGSPTDHMNWIARQQVAHQFGADVLSLYKKLVEAN